MDLANRLQLSIRVFHFLCPVDLARHNNVYRAIYGPKDEQRRELLPFTAFSGYVGQFEQPELGEGFDEIKMVNFVWEGTDEQRKLWDLYMT